MPFFLTLKSLSNRPFKLTIRHFVPSFVFSIIGVVQMVNKKSGVFTASGMNPGEFMDQKESTNSQLLFFKVVL